MNKIKIILMFIMVLMMFQTTSQYLINIYDLESENTHMNTYMNTYINPHININEYEIINILNYIKNYNIIPFFVIVYLMNQI